MSDSPYERVKGGRLTFKGGEVATNSKTIDKKKKKKKSKIKDLKNQQFKQDDDDTVAVSDEQTTGLGEASGEVIYTIDAAKKMKYDDLFPVEAKKFGYDPKAKVVSVEQALDDRVKKKADRYCK